MEGVNYDRHSRGRRGGGQKTALGGPIRSCLLKSGLRDWMVLQRFLLLGKNSTTKWWPLPIFHSSLLNRVAIETVIMMASFFHRKSRLFQWALTLKMYMIFVVWNCQHPPSQAKASDWDLWRPRPLKTVNSRLIYCPHGTPNSWLATSDYSSPALRFD